MKKRKMYFRMITASLIRRRSRMIVALLAIMIGATILSGLVTIYYDVPRQMGAQFRSYGANMILTSQKGSFTEEDVEQGISVIKEEEIVGVAPYHYETVRINERPVIVAATDMSGAKKTSPFWSVSGEWPEKDGQIMIGKNIASTFRLKIGDNVTLVYTPEEAGEESSRETEDGQQEEDSEEITQDLEKTFLVQGILDTGGSEEDYVYVSLNDLKELTDKEISLDICELSVSAASEKLAAYAEQISSGSSGLSAKLVKRVTESETTVLSKLQALVLLVTIIVLALTMICVATTMTAVVAERRQEIGLRKALGASDGSIVKEFMGEGLLLGGLGGILGAVLGFVFAQAVSVNVFNSSISFRPVLLPVAVIVSIVVTGLACLFPIRSATNVDPAVVLKGE